MQYPMIHLNGTSAEELYNKFDEARRALDAAYQALLATAPNARDYYPMGNTVMKTANNEYFGRLEAVEKVTGELSMLAEYCSNHIK
jgi:hypothetical protein